MPLENSIFRASCQWELKATNTGLSATKQSDTVGSNISTPAQELFAKQYTLSASASQEIDFRSFTNLAGATVTGTKLYALFVKVTGANGKAKVEPGTTDPINLSPLLAGTTPSITVSSNGHISIGSDSNPITLDASNKTIKITNTGSASATIVVVAEIGTS